MTAEPIGSVFGLGVAATVPIEGLTPGPSSPGAPRVTVEVRAGSTPAPRPDEPDVVVRQVGADGALLALVAGSESTGFRLFADGYGWCEVDASGTSVVCHPAEGAEPWRWQRLLLGQALPFAAVLNGLEPLHASAVVIGDRVVALAGPSGAGKSTLALELVIRGARFFTDDVLAVWRSAGGALCAPGPALANVRHGDLRERAEAGIVPFAGVLGTDVDGALRALVAPADEEVRRLGAVYFVERGAAATSVEIEPTDDPNLLLGHTFNALVRSPRRLERQLDVCATIASSAGQFRVSAPASLAADELAAAVDLHARQALASFFST